MKPIDIRNAAWEDIQERLTDDRESVYQALLQRSPDAVTTRVLASWMGWDILNVRPRVTELCQLGLAEVVASAGREGLYMAIPLAIARQNIEGHSDIGGQMLFPVP